MCARPSAPPPLRATPMWGRGVGWACAGSCDKAGVLQSGIRKKMSRTTRLRHWLSEDMAILPDGGDSGEKTHISRFGCGLVRAEVARGVASINDLIHSCPRRIA